jgi:adenosylcobinamide-GDP ribazoletransferase
VLSGGEHHESRSAGAGRRLLVALQFLTRMPTPPVTGLRSDDLSRSAVFFPLVGLLIGGGVFGAMGAGALLNPSVAALAGLVAWVAITGALHLDGLGDVADGFGAAHRDPERFREVLRDPHAGNFAIVAIALQIAAKLVLLASLAPLEGGALWPLILIPAWARWGAMLWARTLPALWSGTGASFAEAIGWPGIAAWGAALTLASALAAPALLAALVVVPVAGLFWRWRLGGISGDCLGATIEVTESILLLALLIGTA